jgi:hypothetical protein
MPNRITTPVPTDFNSDEESINAPSDYFPRGSSENVPLSLITSNPHLHQAISAVIDYVPNRQQRKLNRRRVMSNQDTRNKLQTMGLRSELTELQLSTILVPEEWRYRNQ